MNKRLLFCWLGATDLRAGSGETDKGLGPIGQAAAQGQGYDEIILLNNWPPSSAKEYISWLKKNNSANILLQQVQLTGPTNFGEIYQAASAAITDKIKEHGVETDLIFHLSPGTPAMAAVWILLAKTRFPGVVSRNRRKFRQPNSIPVPRAYSSRSSVERSEGNC